MSAELRTHYFETEILNTKRPLSLRANCVYMRMSKIAIVGEAAYAPSISK